MGLRGFLQLETLTRRNVYGFQSLGSRYKRSLLDLDLPMDFIISPGVRSTNDVSKYPAFV